MAPAKAASASGAGRNFLFAQNSAPTEPTNCTNALNLKPGLRHKSWSIQAVKQSNDNPRSLYPKALNHQAPSIKLDLPSNSQELNLEASRPKP